MNEKLFTDALNDNPSALLVRANRMVEELAGDRAVVATKHLDLERYARMGNCRLQPESPPPPVFFRYWGGEDYDRLYTSFDQVVWDVRWRDSSLTVVQLNWDNGCGGEQRQWIVAESTNTAEEFILDVSRQTHSPGNAILVFTDGRWRRSEPLYEAVQSATFDDLILADNLKEAIRTDFSSFLRSEARYTQLGIAWRRGALLIGPPGNGKTHCVRALVKELGVPSLYVQSLSHQRYTPEQLWQVIFERARGLRPCVLVLEDLDSLVNEENRSFFLNQLDGFEQNHGLIVLATTNYPERIDAAIIQRPSRFDRKYHFRLPSLAERKEYLAIWHTKLADETGWLPEQIEPVATVSDGFSFAYLKELVISGVLHWLRVPDTPFVDALCEQARELHAQLETK